MQELDTALRLPEYTVRLEQECGVGSEWGRTGLSYMV